MKLFKLSLAAIVAAGALSSVSAAPLEEAIKDIDVSGFGRYRFQGDSWRTNVYNGFTPDRESRDLITDPDNLNFGGTVSAPSSKITGVRDDYSETRVHDTMHRFTLDVNFKATLDDNFFSVIGLRYDSRDVIGSHKYGNSGLSNTHGGLSGINGGWGGNGRDSLSVRQYYVGFTGIPNTTVLFGRQPAGTFFTDDIVATGLKVVNNSIEGLTLAGVFYTNFEEDGDLANIPFGDGSNAYIHQKNLWGLAAIGSYDWFSFQLWYAGLNKVANLWAVELAANYPIDDTFAVRGTIQVAGTHLMGKFKDNYTVAAPTVTNPLKEETLVGNSTFLGVDLGVSAAGFDFDVGYLTYGKKNKISVHTLEDAGSLIKPGEELVNYTNFHGKHHVWFAKAKYTYDAYSIGLDYVHDKEKNDGVSSGYVGNVKGQEWVVRAGYKYNDKLSFNAWYSFVTKKSSENYLTDISYFGIPNYGAVKEKHNRFRFDARYNF